MIIQEKDIQECWKQSFVVVPALVRLSQEGKKVLCCPHGHSWQDNITLADALEWLKWYKGAANVLVLKTGKDSGVTVIDDDNYGGINLALLQDIPNGTPTAITGNNGHHFFFSYCASIPTASYKTVSIDLRNDGGLIFLPPSCIEGRQYHWIVPLTRYALRPMPEALKDFCYFQRTRKEVKREPGTKTYEQLSTKQRIYLDGYLERCKRARKGKHDRSARDYALCCWAVKIELAPAVLWKLVCNISKFAEKSHGRNYFDLTYRKALRTT